MISPVYGRLSLDVTLAVSPNIGQWRATGCQHIDRLLWPGVAIGALINVLIFG
jgi:hypothetical protein